MRNYEEAENRNILKGIDSWLPPELKDNSALSLEGLIRARVLACVMVCSIALTGLSFSIFVLLHLIAEHIFFNPLLYCFASLILVCLNFFYFYKFAKLDL